MFEEIILFKNALRIIDCKYVSSEILDDIQIRLTYKGRNYILHINDEYKIILLEQIDSVKVGDVDYNEYALLNDIREILPYTQFEGYKASIISYYKTYSYIENIPVMTKRMEVSIDTGNDDITVFKMTIEKSDLIDGRLYSYEGGLYKFDNRLFEPDWLEDFNEKVETYSEEDLFLIISTIASYPYKLTNDLWVGEKIDPFVLDYASSLALEAAGKYINLYPAIEGEDKFSGWYHMWELYFTDQVLEEHLKSRNKLKEKS